MMTKKITLIGVNHESMNTAIYLASLDWQVFYLATPSAVNELLQAYHFDRQSSLLWQLYTADDKILLTDDIGCSNDFWVFFNENTDKIDEKINVLPLTPSSQVILSGTRQIGFFEQLANILKTNWVYYVPFNFLKDGNNFNDFFNIELLLIGEKFKDSFSKSEILLSLINNSEKHYLADIKTIEFARASIMGMLATRLSFINEMARLADSEGVNISQVQVVMGLDRRIGGHYLKAGWGFGGKSLPSELGFLMDKFYKNGVDTRMLQAVSDVNDDQKELIFRKFWRYFDGDIEHKTVVIWGAGYRTGTGRTTGSAIHTLLKLCWAYQIRTQVYAVNTKDELLALYGDEPLFGLIDHPYDELMQAHALFVLNWLGNQSIDVVRLNQVALPIFDAKNIFDDELISKLIGDYEGIGK